MLKSVDFQNSEYSVDNWNYLLDIAAYLISSNSSLKGILCAYYGKNICISDLPLIIKFYEILSNNNNTVNLLIRHILMDKTNLFPFLKYLKSSNHSFDLFTLIFNEFMASEPGEKEIFFIQLFLCQMCDILNIDTEKFKMRAFNFFTTGNWDLLYKCLVIHSLTKTFPYKLKEQFEFLSEICGLEPEELKLEFQEDIEQNRDSSPVFKELFILTGKATPFNCLTQLLKLLEQLYPRNVNEIHHFISYIRKREVTKDQYFNLLFIE